MRKTTIPIIVFMLCVGNFTTSLSSQVALKSSPTSISSENITFVVNCTLSFSEKDMSFTSINEFTTVTLQDCGYLNDIGKPMLPMKTIRVALPTDMKVSSIHILDVQEQPIKGTYLVYPAQKPLPVGTPFREDQFVQPDTQTYASHQPYPPSLIECTGQSDLAGQDMADITLYPLHYSPGERQLTLVSSITFSIKGTGGHVCGDYLPNKMSDTDRTMYQQMMKNMVINPEDVALHSSQSPQPVGVSPGDYEYVIITKDSWTSAFQPLADWKTQKGVPATIVNTTWIYNNGGYSGTNVQKIRAFVQDAYTTWGTTYVLLGGDVDVVPCKNTTFSSVDPDPVPNDAYYADFDSDYVCEVNIGRASVNGTGNGTGRIGNFINKVLTYETNPPLTNYTKKAGFFGFDLDSSTHAQQCKININNSYIPLSWTVKTVYDTQSGNHRTNAINTLNQGQHIVNHADHSNNNCMGVGYVNHNLLLYNSDMDALTNGNKQTILYSMGCDPAAYDVSNCIAEHFVRNSNGGGIAFIGNSRFGWYEYGTYNTLSMGYDIHFFKALFQENFTNLGAAFSDHKNDGYSEYPGDPYYQYIFTELTLLGDPELPVWTENPMNLMVTHPSQLPVGASLFTVSVTTNGTQVNQAHVCLWKGNEVYEKGYTNATGNITFTVSPLIAGSMKVTVTKHNYLPNVSTAQVTGDNLPPYQPSAPTPVGNTTAVSLTTNLSWTGGDPNQGDTVTYDVYFGNSSNPPLVTNNQSGITYDPGSLTYITTYHWKIVAWDNHGASTAGPAWSFTTKANTPPITGTPSPSNVSTDNPLSFTWNISIDDPDGDSFSWTIQCSNGQTNNGTGVLNGIKSLTLTGLTYATPYTVWVNATDPKGSGTFTRTWYTFTTKVSLPPVIGSPSPSNASINNLLNISWSISISDPEGDLFFWTIQCSNGQHNSEIGATNGTKTLELSGLAYSTTYDVWVNATDPTGSYLYTRTWYTFTTQNAPVNNPPVLSNLTPINKSTGVSVGLSSLSITMQDPEGDYFNWTITTLPNIGNSSGTSASNGTKTCSVSGLAYSTTYTWTVRAYDVHDWTNQSFSFTTISYSGGGDDGGSPPPPSNYPPIANVSAGEPYQGDVNTSIRFNGSKSTDPDGNITKWFWVFGDHTNGTGKIIQHVYSETGTYTVTLTVTDNKGATNTDTTTCVITQPNRSPTPPSITGPTQGTKNTPYNYTVVSTDADNDTLRYFIIWGDETSYENTSSLLPSGTPFTCNHRWTTPGIYTITVHASDNKTDSEPAYLIVLIDIKYTGGLGYLIDQDGVGMYDRFYSNSTRGETTVQRQANGTYLIDSNGDGTWEYWYNTTTGALSTYQATTGKGVPGFEVALVLCAIIFILVLHRKRKR